MSINDLIEKVKSKIKPFYTLILIVIISSIFFALGRLSALEERKTPIKITYPNSDETGAVINASADGGLLQDTNTNGLSTQTTQAGGQVVGSKSGKKYYYPWCGTVKMIKPENQVKFASIEEAKAAGFVAGGNCKGLK